MNEVYVVLWANLPTNTKVDDAYPHIQWSGIGGVFETLDDAKGAIKLQHLTDVLYLHVPTKDRLQSMIEEDGVWLYEQYPFSAASETRVVYQIQKCAVRTVTRRVLSE